MFKRYAGKRVLITGHTGFKGCWLTLWLDLLGANVLGYSLPPETEPNMYAAVRLEKRCQSIFGDIRDHGALEKAICGFKPEIVFHLAAQSLVRRSYREPLATYETNVMGALNVLEVSRRCGGVRAFVNVTTDKCYENAEDGHAYREDDPLGGYDMYSSSKACVEILSASYRRSFLQNGLLLATARAGNVIGGGDWAEDRLLPDCIRAIEAGNPVTIRNPLATRPWQFVLEPLAGYLALGEKLLNGERAYAQAFNFGPDGAETVGEVARQVVACYGKGSLDLPEQTPGAPHEAACLQLNADKAKKLLGWKLRYSVSTAVERTTAWYKAKAEACDMVALSCRQIEKYMRVLQQE